MRRSRRSLSGQRAAYFFIVSVFAEASEDSMLVKT